MSNGSWGRNRARHLGFDLWIVPAIASVQRLRKPIPPPSVHGSEKNCSAAGTAAP